MKTKLIAIALLVLLLSAPLAQVVYAEDAPRRRGYRGTVLTAMGPEKVLETKKKAETATSIRLSTSR